MTKMRRLFLLILTVSCAFAVKAQVGQYRNDLAIGINGGVVLSNVGFVPKVPQNFYVGKSAGITMRYTAEKYFNSICAVVAEVNYTQMGWDERIWDSEDAPVINALTGEAEEYARTVNYIQIPFFARLGWGRERRGFQAFFQIGPQIGIYLSESTKANFDLSKPNVNDRISHISGPDINGNPFSNMYFKPIENKLDYGIAGGGGLEFSIPRVGHILLEGRYYYGLGNIYGNTKRDFFAKSNFQGIVVKMTYLFDIMRTKNSSIK